MASQCPHSIVIPTADVPAGVNFCCQRTEGHDGAHVTHEGRSFDTSESWITIEQAQFEESVRTGRAGVIDADG